MFVTRPQCGRLYNPWRHGGSMFVIAPVLLVFAAVQRQSSRAFTVASVK
jgi:hypothetical protein